METSKNKKLNELSSQVNFLLHNDVLVCRFIYSKYVSQAQELLLILMSIINDRCKCLTNSLIPWHDPRSIVLLFSLFSVAFAILNF